MAGFLRRYTNMMSLIDMLRKSEVTLLPTTSWVDRNDRRAIDIFKQKKRHASVVGLCLTEASETFHHWQIFAGGDSGVCIEFDKTGFIDLFADDTRFRCGSMRYLTLEHLRAGDGLGIDDIPFVKRHGFAAEKEFRVIGMADTEVATIAVPFDLSIIRRVTFSPFVNETLARTIRELVCATIECRHIRWSNSRLIESEAWLKAIQKLAPV